MAVNYDVYNEKCPTRKVLEIISDKWVILIIDKLSKKTYRFGELKREIGGISQKVLSAALKKLENNGFILRQDYHVLPLKVEYTLTPLGKSIGVICYEITHWAEQHIDQILRAQPIITKEI